MDPALAAEVRRLRACFSAAEAAFERLGFGTTGSRALPGTFMSFRETQSDSPRESVCERGIRRSTMSRALTEAEALADLDTMREKAGNSRFLDYAG